MMDEIKFEAEEMMERAIESLKRGFLRIRTGRATPEILDGILVNYYGTPTPIKQVANISIPEARLIIVQPWEKNILQEVDKAIYSANIGLTPQNDGNVIRLNIPALTEQRRKELAKDAKALGEDAKVVVRNARRDCNELLKKAEKAKELSEDLLKDGLDEMQKLTDLFIKKIDDLVVLKEKEILEV